MPNGAIVIGVGLSSDKTLLSVMTGDKKSWPVYGTVLNVSNQVRRTMLRHAMRLIGYLPIRILDGVSDSRKSIEHLKIFHHCMGILVEPMVLPSKFGKNIKRHDGSIVRGYPILMSYIADNPEQCRAAGTKQNVCPSCLVDPSDRGENLLEFEYRNQARTLQAMRDEWKIPGSSFVIDDEHLRPCYPPFWRKLTRSNIFQLFTPDLLPQIRKGVFKSHGYEWALQIALRYGNEGDIDYRFCALPEHPEIRMFLNGYTNIKQWTGTKAKAIMKMFVGVIAGLIPSKAV